MAGAFGAVTSIAGGMMQANSARSAGDAQAAAYNYNAQIAENNAVIAKQTALADAKQQHRVNAARHGKMVTQIIKQGVELNTGTPLLILDEDAAQGKLEERKIIHKGDLQAYNYQNEATLQRFYADQAQAAAENQASGAMTSGILGGMKGLFGMFGGGS